MPKTTPKNAAKKCPGRGHGRGHREDPSSPIPSHSPSDGEDAGSNASRVSSVASVAASVASTFQPTFAKRKRAKKTQFCLKVEEEELMCVFPRENAILWDVKKTDYRRVDKKVKLWEDQAKAMGKSVVHLQGWFKSLRDTHTRLHKKKSGDGAPEPTQREQWVADTFNFLQTVVHHHAEPVKSVKATIAAHNGDLEAAEAACADIKFEDNNMASTVSSSSSQCKGKCGQDDALLLQSLQKRVQESGELRRARSRINTILSYLMDGENDEDEPPRVTTYPAPA